jgi:hypothetical protein
MKARRGRRVHTTFANSRNDEHCLRDSLLSREANSDRLKNGGDRAFTGEPRRAAIRPIEASRAANRDVRLTSTPAVR